MRSKPALRRTLRIILLLTIGVVSAGVSSCTMADKDQKLQIIPQPVNIWPRSGSFGFGPGTMIAVPDNNEEVLQIAQLLQEQLRVASGLQMDLTTETGNRHGLIRLLVDTTLLSEAGSEGYYLDVMKKEVELRAADPAGLFYGVQTLFQMLPPTIYGQADSALTEFWQIPCVQIFDKPAFSWRGMHLDVSRHFFPKEFIKRYIDLIAMHKMNVFHWHLTDDNGWRIEIKKYPDLTNIAAWRVDREHQHWRERTPPEPGEEATYGGFYTQDDIREIIAYAQDRYITVIPEIEMPGHSCEVFAAYPEYSCEGKRLYVQPGSYWPNDDIFCAGKESTFRFLEDILAEVADLFPSPYIHIGGDEATKTRWEECELCQQRIREEGLSSEEELQSYFIRRIEPMLTSRGKRLIGWDEILEGGLAPEATVMSWRGYQGGIQAARQGHDVIMCPVSHCYFDYYQADPDFEPLAIGGFTTLRKVYGFEPIPPELDTIEARHVLGAQGNLWTEYIPDPEHAEYMAIPRMTALAEVVWSETASRDWHDFRERLQQQFKRFDAMGVNYSLGSRRVEFHPAISAQGKYTISMETEAYGAEIHYTTDGSEPSPAALLYGAPVEIESDVTLNAAVYIGGTMQEKPAIIEVSMHKAVGAKTEYAGRPHPKYPGNGQITLVDGISGSLNHADGRWQAFRRDGLDVLIDLGGEEEFSAIDMTFLQNQPAWIFLPVKVTCASSLDGQTFSPPLVYENPVVQDDSVRIVNFSLRSDEQVKARYLKVTAESIGDCPEWHWGKGGDAWIFADEIRLK